MENYRKFKEFPQVGKSTLLLIKLLLKYIEEAWYEFILHIYPAELHPKYQETVDVLAETIWDLRDSLKDCWYYTVPAVTVGCLNEMYWHAFPKVSRFQKLFKIKNDSLDILTMKKEEANEQNQEKRSYEKFYLPEEVMQFIHKKWYERLPSRNEDTIFDGVTVHKEIVPDRHRFDFTVYGYCPSSNRKSVMGSKSIDYDAYSPFCDKKFILNADSDCTIRKFRMQFFDYVMSFNNTWKEKEIKMIPFTDANFNQIGKLHYGEQLPEGKVINVHTYSSWYTHFENCIPDSSTIVDSSTVPDTSIGKKETCYGYYEIETDNILNKFSTVEIECHPCLSKYLKFGDLDKEKDNMHLFSMRKLISDKINCRGENKELKLYENTDDGETDNPFVTVKYGNGNMKVIYVKIRKAFK